MPSYSSEVKYYRINANNTAIATSNDGTGSTAPTEEITAPVLGGTYSSGTITITNQTAGAFSAFSVNQYLYYIDSTTGVYVLMGQIASIGSPATTLTLTATALATPASPGASLVASFFLITNTESLYLRVACSTTEATVPGTTLIPDFSAWRTSVNGTNNTSITNLERISNVGVPVSTASPTESIPFTIQTMNVFTTGRGNTASFWPPGTSLPSYMWIKITPASSNNNLSSKTMYRFTTQESFNGIQVGNNTSLATLQGAGYNVSATISNTATTGGTN
jgi:hypothetical protein